MNGLLRVAEWCVLAWGWQRRFAALGAGALGALALAPFGLLPALVLSLTLAVWLIDGDTGLNRRAAMRSAFATGWWFGFGFFLAGLWWLGSAFLVEADQFAWLMPLGVVGLPAGLAFFHAIGFALARLLWSPGPWRIAALAAGLGLSEWLRATVLTGFPWNSYGMALGEHLWLAQAASVIGQHGLDVLAVLIGAAPATLAALPPARRWTGPAVSLALVAVLAGFGLWRLPSAPVATVPDVRLRIMQPNLPQDAKFRPENGPEIMRRYLTLSDRATSPTTTGVADATHLIWPESAFPFLLAREPSALAQIAALLPPGVTLITGAARVAEPLPGELSNRYRNSIHVVGDDGSILSSYDKVHLVPFGEYLPFSDLLTRLGLRQFVPAPGGFEAGSRRAPLTVPGLGAVAPLICYEAIFTREVLPPGPRPALLLNVTNDAWFGDTPGPRQHFAQARLRAIEEGIPLVRAANTGISAVVDPYGRIVGLLPVGREDVLDSALPISLASTAYAQFGNVFFIILIVILSTVAGVAASRRPRL